MSRGRARFSLSPYTTLFRSPRGRPSSPPRRARCTRGRARPRRGRSEEHTSELQSLTNLVCRLLLEKKNEAVRDAPACPRTIDGGEDNGPADRSGADADPARG